jgi:hypothetical protein
MSVCDTADNGQPAHADRLVQRFERLIAGAGKAQIASVKINSLSIRFVP